MTGFLETLACTPDHVPLISLCLRLDVEDVVTLCFVCKQLNRVVAGSSFVWKNLLLHDYDFSSNASEMQKRAPGAAQLIAEDMHRLVVGDGRDVAYRARKLYKRLHLVLRTETPLIIAQSSATIEETAMRMLHYYVRNGDVVRCFAAFVTARQPMRGESAVRVDKINGCYVEVAQQSGFFVFRVKGPVGFDFREETVYCFFATAIQVLLDRDMVRASTVGAQDIVGNVRPLCEEPNNFIVDRLGVHYPETPFVCEGEVDSSVALFPPQRAHRTRFENISTTEAGARVDPVIAFSVASPAPEDQDTIELRRSLDFPVRDLQDTIELRRFFYNYTLRSAAHSGGKCKIEHVAYGSSCILIVSHTTPLAMADQAMRFDLFDEITLAHRGTWSFKTVQFSLGFYRQNQTFFILGKRQESLIVAFSCDAGRDNGTSMHFLELGDQACKPRTIWWRHEPYSYIGLADPHSDFFMETRSPRVCAALDSVNLRIICDSHDLTKRRAPLVVARAAKYTFTV